MSEQGERGAEGKRKGEKNFLIFQFYFLKILFFIHERHRERERQREKQTP